MQNLNKLLFANGLFSFARMFVGAVFVLVLLDKGISVSTISLAKAIQLAVSALITVPSGVFADRYGRKNSILLACIFGMVYYALLISPTTSGVIIGEAFNGLAIGFYSGAFESWLFSMKNDSDNKNKITHMLARSNEIEYLAIVLAGVLGSFASKNIFPVSFILMGLTLIVFSKIRDDHAELKPSHRYSVFELIKKSSSHLLENGNGRLILICGIGFIGFMQIIYQFWQPYFMEAFPGSVNAKMLGLIFSGFMFTQFLISRFTRKYLLKKEMNLTFLIGGAWILASSSLALLVLKPSFLSVGIVLFCLFQGFSAMGHTLLFGFAGSYLDEKLQATAFSLVDFFGRICGAVVLGIGHGFLGGSSVRDCWILVLVVLISLSIYAFSKEINKRTVTVGGSI